MFLRHLGRLLGELSEFAWQNKVWWLLPMMVMLLLIALLIAASETGLPWIYTF